VQLFVGIFARVPLGQLETHILVEDSANKPLEQVHSHFLVELSAKTPAGHY